MAKTASRSLDLPELWRRYQEMPPTAKALLRLRDLLDVPPAFALSPSASELAECLTRAGVPSPGGKVWMASAVMALEQQLMGQGLLGRGQEFRPRLLHPVAVDTLADPEAAPLVQAVRDLLADRNRRAASGSWYGSSGADTIRQIRLDIYANDETAFRNHIASNVDLADNASRLFHEWFATTPVDLDWLESRTPALRYSIFAARFFYYVQTGGADLDFAPVLARFRECQHKEGYADIRRLLILDDILVGRLTEARAKLADFPDTVTSYARPAIAATLDFLSGDNAAAVDQVRTALKLLRKAAGKRKVFFQDSHGVFHLLALLRTGDPALYAEIRTFLDIAQESGHPYYVGFDAVRALLELAEGDEARARSRLEVRRQSMPPEPLSAALVGLAEYRLDPELARRHHPDTAARFIRFKREMPLVARIHAEVLAGIAADPTPYRAFLETPGHDPVVTFVDVITPKPAWERLLERLDDALAEGRTTEATASKVKAKRLAWLVDRVGREVRPVEQTARGSGWTTGRAIAGRRLHEQGATLDYLTDHDRQVLRALHASTSGWYGDVVYAFKFDEAIRALVGHPAVFDDHNPTGLPIDLVAHPLELVIEDHPEGYRIGLSHTATAATVFVEPETPTRWRVVDFPAKAVALQGLLGPAGRVVPKAARERIVALARREQPSLPVRAEIAEVGLAPEPGNAAPVVQLQPVEGGHRVMLAVRPFGPEGPYYLPGHGARLALAMIDGQARRVARDLDREHAEAAALVAACPSLNDLGDGPEWLIEDLERVLELLGELHAYTGGPVGVEWPEGKRITVGGEVSSGKLSLRVGQGRDWFQVSGTVAVDEDQVVDLREVLDRLDRAHGRFVPLDDGRFLALSRKLQAQLRRLNAVSEAGKDGRRLHPLGMVAVDELLEDAGSLKADRAWKEFVERRRTAESAAPAVPATLQAELRDYQAEGYAWLMRLARWGAGACLADDMGLGKTVQAIAAMLALASEGPVLVVAPTSVVANWVAELARFAPTLRVQPLAAAPDRAALLTGLGAMDVVVASYGLLLQEADRLAAVTWRMAVLDEAQAIKNAETRRAQASLRLRADFRLALTGTPIENSLDELWSLFNVINPGLLGSFESFRKRFAVPIERDRNVEARQALRALIRPFILRRTKSQVLAELPARTEQTLAIEMGAEERAFYEALRRKALEKLAELSEAGGGGRKRIQILAEITRLRRACCDPALIEPAVGIESSKRAVFLELVDELRRNRHRALVFSQFVGHLDRVRLDLDALDIDYQYLDGSTPAKERERRVAAFQAGEGDLFLISLRAGGTGLNLTAADYVIHLDPWWNPAVEDQASDRAHRIGQTRPVTIYRLIEQDSIEEKILRLHRDKRDLASDLLEGTEISARLSDDELLEMIRG